MTIYGQPTSGNGVVGAQLHPNFSQQSSGGAPAAVTVSPPGSMTILEAAARGVLPRNVSVSTVNSVSTGANNPVPVDDLACNGAGAQVNLGVPPVGGANGALDQQQFVAGTLPNAQLANGPTPTNVDSLTSAPVSVATTCGNVGLSGTYQG
jgi:hypothetical protein